jgi:MoaA/NifB/PqqE/SkfB family radical SAM enzyme
MDITMALALIDELQSMGVPALTWSGCGEPTLHPQFSTMVKRAAALNQGMFTNALLYPEYDPSHFDWIRVTVVPGRALNLDNLRKLREAKTLGLCCNVGPDDDDEICKTLDAAKKIGADYVHVRPVLLTEGQSWEVRRPTIDDPLLVYDEGKFSDPYCERNYRECRGFHFSPFVWFDGEVTICAYLKGNPAYSLGNLRNTSFNKIMMTAMDFAPVIRDCQVNCKNHEANELTNAAMKIRDPNFV